MEEGGTPPLQAEDEREEAFVDTVDDGINTGPDDVIYSYWQIIKFSVLTYLSNPWAMLIFLFLLYKIYGRLKQRFLLPLYDRYDEWCEQRKIEKEAALMKKNPDEYREKMEAMERARSKLQEHYQRSAEAWAEKQAELEEKRRQQDIEDWESHQKGEGYKSRANTGEDKAREALEQQARVKGKKGFRPEYNPLMGMGGGSGYRPSRRSMNTGGG